MYIVVSNINYKAVEDRGQGLWIISSTIIITCCYFQMKMDHIIGISKVGPSRGSHHHQHRQRLKRPHCDLSPSTVIV